MTMHDAPPSVRRFTSFADARAASGGALDGTAQPGPFDRLDWFEALHASGFAGQRPLIRAARSGTASAWLFLVSTRPGAACGLANWYSFLHRPQFAGDPAPDARAALLAALMRDLRRDHRRLRLHPVVDDPGGLMTALAAAGWRVVPRTLGHKRVMRLSPGTRFADYWAARPGVLRTTLARKAGRHRLDIRIHAALTGALWRDFEAVFAASWKPRGDDFAFLRRFAEREAQAGRLRLGIARDGSGPVAVELWTVDQGIAYIHKLAFAEAASAASPGTQLSHAMFAHAIDVDGVETIDFGTGDNRYKARWIADTVPMLQLDAFDLRKPASWLPAARAALSAMSPLGDSKVDGRRAALGRRGG